MKTLAAVFCLLSLSSCEEVLPTREDLTNQISVSLSQGYISRNGASFFVVYIIVKNNIDETVEDFAHINGTVQIEWIPRPEKDAPFNKVRSIKFNQQQLFSAARSYNPLTGKLAIAPNDSIIFAIEWNLKTNDSTFLMNHFYGFVDSQCMIRQLDGYPSFRKISSKEHFKVSANIRLFEKLSVLHTDQLTMTSCIVGPHLGELNPPNNPCVNVNFINPCSIIGQ